MIMRWAYLGVGIALVRMQGYKACKILNTIQTITFIVMRLHGTHLLNVIELL